MPRRLIACLFLFTLLRFTAVPTFANKSNAPLAYLNGQNYDHWAIESNCHDDETGLLLTYDLPGVRARAQQQLAYMHKHGFATLRMVIWHRHQIYEYERWGIIASGPGLVDQYLANFENLVRDIRDAGFIRYTVSFAPGAANSPYSVPGHPDPEDPNWAPYDPALFPENWQLIQNVRAILLANGPPEVRLDLLNEGGPSMFDVAYDQVSAYDVQIWHQYVTTYGVGGATISSSIELDPERLENLIDLIQANGDPLPDWFEIHAYDNPGVDIPLADDVLTAKGLTQPFVLGETFYHDPGNRNAVRHYTGAHPIQEYIQWWLKRDNTCAGAPYTP